MKICVLWVTSPLMAFASQNAEIVLRVLVAVLHLDRVARQLRLTATGDVALILSAARSPFWVLWWAEDTVMAKRTKESRDAGPLLAPWKAGGGKNSRARVTKRQTARSATAC